MLGPSVCETLCAPPKSGVSLSPSFVVLLNSRTWLFFCSLYIPYSTSACFTYTLLTGLTFLHTSFRTQLVTVLIKGAVKGMTLC